MWQNRSSKIAPIGFSSHCLASYLAENGHDIRQMTSLLAVVGLTLYNEDASLVQLHLTVSGLACLLALWGRQEHDPFPARLRGLKLEDCLPRQLVTGDAGRAGGAARTLFFNEERISLA